MLTHFYAENIEHRRWGAPFPVIEIVAWINQSTWNQACSKLFKHRRRSYHCV